MDFHEGAALPDGVDAVDTYPLVPNKNNKDEDSYVPQETTAKQAGRYSLFL